MIDDCGSLLLEECLHEVALLVRELLDQLHPHSLHLSLQLFQVPLLRRGHQNHLRLLHFEFPVPDADGLVALADDRVQDVSNVGVVVDIGEEISEVEVSMQLAVDPRQDVLGAFHRQVLVVEVGQPDGLWVLLQVDRPHRHVAFFHVALHELEELLPLGLLEIPNRPSHTCKHVPALLVVVSPLDALLIEGGQGGHLDVGRYLLDGLDEGKVGTMADVDRDVLEVVLLLDGLLDQELYFLPVARSQLH